MEGGDTDITGKDKGACNSRILAEINQDFTLI